MGFIIPKISTISNDIKDISIYLRSVKKWGKSTLFRDVVLMKYNDLTKGVLVECGLEHGDSMLNANMVHLDKYKEFTDFKKWLIDNKGKEHHIEMVCFDTADEMIPIFEKEIIKQYNIENPTKPVKTIKAAYGGYNAGVEMVANLIKKYMGEIKQAGFGVWVIAHSKFKQIKEKGGLEEEGYMQLTSNLISPYESAFGDIFDCTLTGVIDRVFEEKSEGKKVKKYTTDSIRKLYFRGTTLIDAGGRFAMDTVPEYLEYDCSSLEFAKKFIDTVENGLKNSAIDISKTNTQTLISNVPKSETSNKIDETSTDDDFDSDIESLDESSEETDIDEVADTDDIEEVIAQIREQFKAMKRDKQIKFKGYLDENNIKLGELEDISLARKLLEMM